MSTTVELHRMGAELQAVRAELVALRAGVAELAETWEGWADGRSTMRIDAFRDAAEALRDILTTDAES